MRILHLNTYASGGSYEYAALLSSALAEQGTESRVLCRSSQPREGLRLFVDRVVRRGYVALSREPWHGTRRLLPPPEPNDWHRFDAVHLHTVADWFDVPTWLQTLPNETPIVVSLHDMWHFTGGCFLYRGCDLFSDACAPCPILKPPFTRFLAKGEQKRKFEAYWSRRVQFIANSHWLGGLADRSAVVRACGGARVVTPAIDTAFFQPQDKAQCRAELGVPQDDFVIAAGAASLTDPNKNIQWLLEQLSQLPTLENVKVLLLGEGKVPAPDRLNVRFMGNVVNRQERARVFAAADVFISSSLMETYGLTLVEAMGCGTPVVAFRVGGIPEAAPDGEASMLCEPLDPAALVAAVQKLRNSPQLRNDLGTTASKLVAARNSKALFATAFVRVYDECIRSAKTPLSERSPLVH